MIELRDYQEEAIQSVFDYWAAGGGSPLIDMATGLGKSVVIAELKRRLLTSYADMRALSIVHVRELVEQNYMQLRRLWGDAPAGIYSAGLGRRDAHHRITFASVQSVYKKARELGPRDVLIIDEAHLIPTTGNGMYRTLIEGLRAQVPDMRIVGLSATPYRMDSGRLDGGKDAIFDKTVFSYGIARGIDEGYLSPLTCKPASVEIDVSDVQRRGGEFVPGALEAAANTDALTLAAAEEIARVGALRRSWLIFCTGVAHAHAVAAALRALGVNAATITGETDAGERARLIADFKAGRVRALTNAQVLTTGFDAPGTDLIAFLRPTLSTGLYVQMIGRGTRKAEGKDNCLVLDFAGNVRRHGPVDAVEIRDKKKNGDEYKATIDSVRSKECPNCQELLFIAARACKFCDYQYPVDETPDHETKPDTEAAILSRDVKIKGPEEAPVIAWAGYVHLKAEGKPSLRIEYSAGLMTYREWVAVEHTGFARDKAERWWLMHGGRIPVPKTAEEAKRRFTELKRPEAIFVRPNGKWFDIVARRFPREEDAA